ncbi:MAG: hypothetical protein COB02_06560 [Candidatus Cloacimonadota bacterium]|nr:MAG: hypothetical protein COB02_06560 [Candidatus Cloacimonadota bacterium]
MTKVFHPKLKKIEDVAVLSVASFHKSFKESALLDFLQNPSFIKFPESITNYDGFSCDDLLRQKALINCFDKPRFVIASRGGYGSIRSLINCHFSKDLEGVLTGFSDLTVLINYLSKNTKIACFHGPMFSYPNKWKKSSYLEKSFQSFFCSDNFNYEDSFEGKFICGNLIEGKLYGGNLSVICSMIGTPFELDLDGIVLFLEEINEPTYNIDRMLTQLSLQKNFKKLKGLVFGQFTNCVSRPKDCGDLEIFPMVKSFVKEWNIPAVWGAPIGHIEDFMVMPISGESLWKQEKNKVSVRLGYPTNI